MAAMFERAVSNFPEMEPEMISLDPPVLVFEKFVTDDEVHAPPRLATVVAYVRNATNAGYRYRILRLRRRRRRSLLRPCNTMK